MIKTKTFKENLETLYNSLEQKQREPGLGCFYCLKENLENKEEIQRFIELLHNEESPNDSIKWQNEKQNASWFCANTVEIEHDAEHLF